MITSETILVSIGAVNSEIGIKQPIEKIAELIKEYPTTIFHVDATQAIGKIKIDYKNVDLISMSAHKIYGIKGIGALFKKAKWERTNHTLALNIEDFTINQVATNDANEA